MSEITDKKRILFVGEASYLQTGYSTYYNEVISRVFKTGKYEVAEFGAYGLVNDPRRPPWKFYANHVQDNDPRIGQMRSNPINEFGLWRFDRVVLDFKPDCIITIRDFWMDSFVYKSPLRPFYNLVQMAPVDSAPQQPEWLDSFIDADGIFTYEDYGKRTLEKEGGGKINLLGSTPPSANSDVYKPVLNKESHKKKFGLDPDKFIVGTVMRNQGRKLFPDLMESYTILQKQNPALAAKTYFYFHTSFPDNGWDIPGLLSEFGISNRVYFTYVCFQCGHYYPSLFQDAKTQCPMCKGFNVMFPKSTMSIDISKLAEIYNLFDVYVQYANCEGLGIPALEAAFCGVPVMEVDYSAMSDVVRKVGGFPIKVQRFFREIGVNAWRALPDNNDFVNQLEKFLSTPANIRRKRANQTAALARQNYSWDNTAQKWMDYFDSVDVNITRQRWGSPPFIIEGVQPPPENLTNSDFIRWCYEHIVGDGREAQKYQALSIARDLDNGFVWKGNGIEPFTRETVINILSSITNNRNQVERARCGMAQLPVEDYIENA